MIKLKFVREGILRQIFIKDKIITMITPENSFNPVNINVTSITIDKLKTSKLNKKQIQELISLKTDEDMVKDITSDFTSLGWRLINRDG